MKPTTRQIDILKELLNIGIGQSAAVLNTILKSHINLHVPRIQFLSFNELNSTIQAVGDEHYTSVSMIFNGEFSGNAGLVFSSESALKLVIASTGNVYKSENFEDFDEIRASTLSEIGNIVLNSVIGTISNMLKLSFSYSVPLYNEGGADTLFSTLALKTNTVVILAKTRFTVETLNIEGDIIILFKLDSFNKFLSLIDKLDSELSVYGQL